MGDPQGPSLDPAVKRLAMETEPHPKDYNRFEGVIPKGTYGGGTVMIWDKGVWAPLAQDRLGDEAEAERQLKKGDLKFVLRGEKLLGSWVLVRTRGDRQWLLIKHRDEYTSGDDLTLTKPRSVVSGRTMAELDRAAGATPRQLQQATAADPDTLPLRSSPHRPPSTPSPPTAARSRPRRVPRRAVTAGGLSES